MSFEAWRGVDNVGGVAVNDTQATRTMVEVTNTNPALFTAGSGGVTVNKAMDALISFGDTLGTVGTGDFEFTSFITVNGSEVSGSRGDGGKGTSTEAAVATLTADTTLAALTHEVLLVDASASPIILTLPAAEVGVQFDIKKIDASANTVTIDGAGSDTTDDGLTAVLTDQYEAITIVSDGTDWWIL